MKQILLSLVAILFCCCSSDSDVKAEVPVGTAKTLVVYYSYTGNCREIVNTLTSQIQADVLEIQPAEKGLRYEANNYALGMQLLTAIKADPDNESSYPAIDPVNVSLSHYQNIIIVTPLWWSQMAAIMQTYLFQIASQVEGKHVGLIVSSHSSGISGVVSDAQRLLPHAAWMGDALWIHAGNHSQRASLIENWLGTLNFAEERIGKDKMYITIGGVTQSVTLVDNAATRELIAALHVAPITITLSDNKFEVWGSLGRTLPTHDEPTDAAPGDMVLYGGSNICLFYDSNSWSYTRLGKIDNLSGGELRTFLKAGEADITATLSLPSHSAAIQSVSGTRPLQESEYYSLSGVKTNNPSQGLYIKNRKKVILCMGHRTKGIM